MTSAYLNLTRFCFTLVLHMPFGKKKYNNEKKVQKNPTYLSFFLARNPKYI